MSIQNEISMAAARVYGSKYDAATKELFGHPEIIAPILRLVVPEYKNHSTEEVIACIERESIQSDPVDSSSRLAAEKLATEMNSIGEKLIRYDTHFKARNPVLSDERISVDLHVDMEVQNDYRPSNPSYPVIKRAVYYGAREISSQLGILTSETNYAKLEKVYSIWICNENIPKKLVNTVSSYSIVKKDEVGITDEPDSDYDLLTVILIRRGSDSSNNYELFDYLNGIFSGNRDTIGKYVDLDSNEAVMEGVNKMTGLGESLFSRGVQEGRQEGRLEMLASLVRQNLLALADAAGQAGMTEEEFAAKFMENRAE